MRVVLDTNVLIDGNTDDFSYANKIIDEVLSGKIEAYANPKTIKENALIVERTLQEGEYAEKINTFLERVQRVEPVWIDVDIEDAEDRKILASAVAAKADYLITSDKHLLKLEEFEGINIVEPVVFWNRFREEVLGENDWQKFIGQFFKS